MIKEEIKRLIIDLTTASLSWLSFFYYRKVEIENSEFILSSTGVHDRQYGGVTTTMEIIFLMMIIMGITLKYQTQFFSMSKVHPFLCFPQQLLIR